MEQYLVELEENTDLWALTDREVDVIQYALMIARDSLARADLEDLKVHGDIVQMLSQFKEAL